jgi:hypothetical protein
MCAIDDPQEAANLEEVSERLSTGLKNCRTIMSNYRAMIAGEPEEETTEVSAGQSAKD